MSKFSERLSNLGQAAPARMGFGRSQARDKNPVMLVIGKGGDASKQEEAADLHLHDAGDAPDSGQWGAVLDGNAAPEAEKLEKGGCQFAIVNSDAIPAEILLSEEISFGMPVEAGLSESRIRAIEDGPFDFLVITPESLSWPLTVGSTLDLQELISSFSKHIFLELPASAGLPGKKDLEVLKNLPVSALVVDLGSVSAKDSAGLRETIAGLEPRKQPAARSERSPLVPLANRGESAEAAGDDSFDDEDDWDD